MTDEHHRKWDIITKVLGFVGVIATLAVGVYQFRLSAAREARAVFWTEKRAVYAEALEKATQIMRAGTRQDGYNIYQKDFYLFYQGKLQIYLDDTTRKPFADLNACFADLAKEDRHDAATFLNVAAVECGESLREGWIYPFGR